MTLLASQPFLYVVPLSKSNPLPPPTIKTKLEHQKACAISAQEISAKLQRAAEFRESLYNTLAEKLRTNSQEIKEKATRKRSEDESEQQKARLKFEQTQMEAEFRRNSRVQDLVHKLADYHTKLKSAYAEVNGKLEGGRWELKARIDQKQTEVALVRRANQERKVKRLGEHNLRVCQTMETVRMKENKRKESKEKTLVEKQTKAAERRKEYQERQKALAKEVEEKVRVLQNMLWENTGEDA